MKKLFFGFVLVMALFLVSNRAVYALSKCGNSITGINYKVCDVNKDGSINKDDATALLQNVVNSEDLTNEQIALSDANGDGKVNTGDATNILIYIDNLLDANDYTGQTCKEISIDGYRLGDVNKDGEITNDDAEMILKYVVGTATISNLKLAETVGDEKVNTGDAAEILRYVQNDAEFLKAECIEPIANPKTSDVSIIFITLVAVGALVIVLYQYNKRTKLN